VTFQRHRFARAFRLRRALTRARQVLDDTIGPELKHKVAAVRRTLRPLKAVGL
jgi:hypothetical protein